MIPKLETSIGASQGPDAGLVLYTKPSRLKWTSPTMLMSICIWYQAGSLMWYAAKSLTMPTAAFHVPKVLEERGVAGDVF
jgi:hypothetical protein